MPAAFALVTAPSSAPGTDPANSATIQSGDITSSKRPCLRKSRMARASAAGPITVRMFAAAKLNVTVNAG
jgi:hypothetical protein